MIKGVLIGIFVCLLSSTILSQPAIIDFTPKNGPIGTVVTITGSGFSNITSENIVYFGAVKGTVLNSTTNSISVSVPVGATLEPLTVITNGLVG